MADDPRGAILIPMGLAALSGAVVGFLIGLVF